MLRTSLMTAVLTTAFASAHAAPAPTVAPLTANQVLNQFNAVSLGNINASSAGHVHGRTWAAGSVMGEGEYGNQLSRAAASNYAGLTAASVVGTGNNGAKVNQGGIVVSGSVSGVNVNEGSNWVGGSVSNSTLNRTSYVGGSAAGVNFNGSAWIEGDASGSTGNYSRTSINGPAYIGGNATNVTANGGATIRGNATNSTVNGGTIGGTRSNVNFNNNAFTPLVKPVVAGAAAANSTNFSGVLNNLSDSLKTLKSTGSSVAINGNKATFTAVANSSGVAVFDLTGFDDALFKLGEFQFNLNGIGTVIMNSDVKSATIGANFLGGSAFTTANNVIWNFYDATSLTIATQFGGTVLATDALVTNTRDIEGGLFAKSLDLRAQVHVQGFTGNVGMLSPVPEPTTVAMLMAGLGILGFARLRRREAPFARV